MSRNTSSSHVLEQQSRILATTVHQAAAAAREALKHFDPSVRSLAIRQLSVDAEIFAVATERLADPPQTLSASPVVAVGPFTMDEVAERCHVSRDCVAKWVGTGKLRKTKAGRRVLITEEALQEFLTESTAKSVPRSAVA